MDDADEAARTLIAYDTNKNGKAKEDELARLQPYLQAESQVTIRYMYP